MHRSPATNFTSPSKVQKTAIQLYQSTNSMKGGRRMVSSEEDISKNQMYPQTRQSVQNLKNALSVVMDKPEYIPDSF